MFLNKSPEYEIRRLTKRLVNLALIQKHKINDFIPGITHIPVTGKVFGERELSQAIKASLEFWLTSGPYTEEFERKLAQIIGTRHAFMVNSGSSANLLALSSLTSLILGDRKLSPGDEVITVASGFPTTITPILQNRLVPVYVDIDIGTYVANEHALQEAISSKTKAIMMAHTLGNPANLKVIENLAKQYNLWFIEDNCDALGGTYDNKMLGSFGDLSTLSFYPAHHITTGEGGAVLTKRSLLKPIIESFRDWGRDCWCAPGCDNTCQKRFDWKLGDLPAGYDHKYIYSHIGYNLKSGDIQAAIGLAQIERLPNFISKRRENWEYLADGIKTLAEFLVLPVATKNSNPSWFGFCLTVKKSSPKNRNTIVRELNELNIGTRLLFAGNILKQPGFINTPSRVVGDLINTNKTMEDSFWIGVWPGLTKPMLDYVIVSLHKILGVNL